ncbi:MAG: helix-turn-helix transcriptional regulator, partial [Acidimicrobiia bacterium]|nr:helix-turn-helix transcriptional regulator [Acidimicrobiia bacterium]
MPARLPAPERRQQLLATAQAMFARLGYRDASMNDIAEAAGVTKPVLYQHFGSKRELFGEVLVQLSA